MKKNEEGYHSPFVKEFKVFVGDENPLDAKLVRPLFPSFLFLFFAFSFYSYLKKWS